MGEVVQYSPVRGEPPPSTEPEPVVAFSRLVVVVAVEVGIEVLGGGRRPVRAKTGFKSSEGYS